MTTATLFHFSNKDLEEICGIVITTKAANMAKQILKAIENLKMMVKKNRSRENNSKPNKNCFNCGTKSYYSKDCHSLTSNKRK